MAQRLVTADFDGFVAELTMRNTSRLNSISPGLATGIVEAVEEAESAGSRVIILRAEPGVTTWSAGYDIKELPTDAQDPLTWSNSLEKLLRRIRSVETPIIAAVEGGVWGGACELIMSVDLVVACETSSFAITPARLGVAYNTAGVARFLASLPIHIVKEMFYLADPIDAQRMYELGVVNRITRHEQEMTEVSRALAQRIATRAPLTIRAVKAETEALTDAKPMTSDVFERLTQARNAAWRSQDYLEGLAAFKERRTPDFRGY